MKPRFPQLKRVDISKLHLVFTKDGQGGWYSKFIELLELLQLGAVSEWRNRSSRSPPNTHFAHTKNYLLKGEQWWWNIFKENLYKE